MDMKERILEGAADLYSRFGQSKVRMEEIAAYVNISKKTIYNHYGSKTELFHETINYSLHKLVNELNRITEDKRSNFGDRIHSLLGFAYREIGKKHSPFFEDLRMHNPILGSTPILFLRERTEEIIHTLIDDAREEGIIRTDIDTMEATYVFLNIMSGLFTWDDSYNLPISRVEILRTTIQVLLEGLLTDNGRSVLKDSLADVIENEEKADGKE